MEVLVTSIVGQTSGVTVVVSLLMHFTMKELSATETGFAGNIGTIEICCLILQLNSFIGHLVSSKQYYGGWEGLVGWPNHMNVIASLFVAFT